MATTEARKPRPGGDRPAVDQPRRSVGFSPGNPGLADGAGHRGGEQGEPRGEVPGAVEAGRPHQRLTQRRAEREAQVEAQRVVAQRLADPARRRQVGERGDRRDEERRLGDAEDQPESDDRRAKSRPRGQHMATAQSSAPPTSSGRRPCVSLSRPANGRSTSAETANAPNASPAARRVRADRPGDVERQGVDCDTGGREVRQVRRRQQHEGGREEPVAGLGPGAAGAVEVAIPTSVDVGGRAGMGSSTQVCPSRPCSIANSAAAARVETPIRR